MRSVRPPGLVLNGYSARQTRSLRRGVIVLAAGLVAFIAASALIILLLINDARDDPKSLEDVVTTSSSESAALTDLYFLVAEASAEIVDASVVLAGASLDEMAFLNTLQHVVATHDNVNGAFVGLPSGDFVYVTRSLAASPGGFRTKRVEDAETATRRVTERQYDDTFAEVGEVVEFDDDYDPRTRPWYLGALEGGHGWTDPYVFASSGEPGITYFMEILSRDGDTLAVVGVDLELAEIRDFLAERQPGENGSAAIVSEESGIIIGSSAGEEAQNFASQVLATRDVTTDSSLVLRDEASRNGLRVASIVPVGSNDQWTLVIVGAAQDFPQPLAVRLNDLTRLLPPVAMLLSLVVLALAAQTLRRLKRLHDVAMTDPMTGLFNQVEIRTRLDELLSTTPGRRAVVAAIDVDRSCRIADMWGYDGGRQVVQRVATRLAERIGTDGVAGRVDGTEFLAGLIIPSEVNALSAVGELVQSLVDPADDSVPDVVVDDIACGFALREPGEEMGLVAILRNTDLALLSARSQMNAVVQYDPLMDLPSAHDQQRKAEMLGALGNGEFEVHFQPEVRLADGAITGAEALVRWRQPDGSLIPAKDFIEDLERLEIIDQLSPLVFEQASALVERIDTPNFTMRINCCAGQLANDWLLSKIACAHRTTTANWCVELTERTVIASDEPTLAALSTMKDAGVTLALDDFGTGYSSFAELQNLPITTLKVDRSLVAPLTAANAVNSMASLIYEIADRLSLEIVAEGIETPEQQRALQSLGYTSGQGWLFGAAAPLKEFPADTGVAISR